MECVQSGQAESQLAEHPPHPAQSRSTAADAGSGAPGALQGACVPLLLHRDSRRHFPAKDECCDHLQAKDAAEVN